MAQLCISPYLNPSQSSLLVQRDSSETPLMKTGQSGLGKHQMRKTDANSCPLEHFSGTFNPDKTRVMEELQMCTSGLALGPGRPNSHLHLSPVGYVLLFISVHSFRVEINFHRLTPWLFFLGI